MNTSYSTAHGTLVNCIDGTVQVSPIDFLKKAWNVQWVDVITDVAPERILAQAKPGKEADHIHDNIKASFCNQQTKRLAIVSHSDCDMNELSDDSKKEMLLRAVDRLKSKYADADVLGIWIDREGVLSPLSREAH